VKGAARSSLRTPLGRVTGLGSARGGVHHWWAQRLTSLALVPLAIWFAVSLLSLHSLDHVTVVAWMAHSWTALLLMLFVLVASWHSHLGVRVVVEDYIHDSGTRTLVLVILTFAHVLVAVAGVFAVLKVAFGGGG
jgi:succinate dehydrogenase / fumarate reductase, membrane anchor subunit